MTDMVTRCPACSTSFRITEAQLQTAKGAVRCGSCLQIFKALDHLVEGAPGAATRTAAKTPTPSRASAAKTPAKKTPAAKKTRTKPAAPKAGATAAKPAAKTSARKPAPKQTGLKFDQAAIDTESEAGGKSLPDIDDDTLISDDMDLDEATKKADAAKDNLGTLSDSFLELESWKPEKTSLFDREINATQEEESDTADESWAIDLLEELEDEEAEDSSPADTDRLSDEFNYSNDTTFAPADEKEELFEPEVEEEEPGFNLRDDEDLELALEETEELDDSSYDSPAISLRAHQSERTAMLSRIEPAPVEMAWDAGGRLWGAKLRWGALATVAGLVLLVQLSWSQFDRLSRVEPYRAWYGVMCAVFGCDLPDLVAAEKIRAYNLVVRSHPKAEKALVVDTILLNTAPFDQPFPKLTLSFSKLDGTPLAVRSFTPKEYLGGEMVGRTHMPSGQPVHLSLEIVDPGRDAVNYSIAITP